MMNAPATAHNLELLKSRGIHLLEPEEGYLASGLTGKGRLPEPDDIVAHIETLLDAKKGPLYGKKIVVTAGPTREFIDPVRFISNPSSGKMGLAMAKAAHRLGGQVHLVHGPISLSIPEGIYSYSVVSAQDMFEQVKALHPADLFIKAAARAKRTKKNADWIVANYIGTHQQGFASDYNSVTLVGDGVEESFEGPKDDLAMSLLRSIFLS